MVGKASLEVKAEGTMGHRTLVAVWAGGKPPERGIPGFTGPTPSQGPAALHPQEGGWEGDSRGPPRAGLSLWLRRGHTEVHPMELRFKLGPLPN